MIGAWNLEIICILVIGYWSLPLATKIFEIHPQFPEMDRLAQCAKIIRQGGLVIFPTETVYGIAADYDNKKALDRLRQVKRRSENKPFSVIISQRVSLLNLTNSTNQMIFKLVDRFWPGPLTVVVPAKAEGQTIGVRMPDHAIALNLVQEAECTVAAPSANVEGREPPKTCAEALKDLDGQVEAAIDGGPSQWGKSSTVVDCTGTEPKILREGVIAAADIERVAKQKTVVFVCTGNSCRSVMAEYLMKKLLGNRPDVEVLSAGTSVFIRSGASAETIHVLRREGMDATLHQSQSINSIMLKKADLIIVMTDVHRQHIVERLPEVEKRMYLLREFANIPAGSTSDLDVSDPIGRSPQAYEECLSVIKDAVGKIVNLV